MERTSELHNPTNIIRRAANHSMHTLAGSLHGWLHTIQQSWKRNIVNQTEILHTNLQLILWIACRKSEISRAPSFAVGHNIFPFTSSTTTSAAKQNAAIILSWFKRPIPSSDDDSPIFLRDLCTDASLSKTLTALYWNLAKAFVNASQNWYLETKHIHFRQPLLPD